MLFVMCQLRYAPWVLSSVYWYQTSFPPLFLQCNCPRLACLEGSMMLHTNSGNCPVTNNMSVGTSKKQEVEPAAVWGLSLIPHEMTPTAQGDNSSTLIYELRFHR